jgi:hypothetical protein
MSRSLRSAIAAIVLIVPVALELAWSPFGDHVLGLEVFALSQLAGWLLLWSVCRTASAPAGRVARFGRRAVLAGCWLQVTFAATYAATAVDNEPLEASFVFLLLGFLVLFVGGLAWGLRLPRISGAVVVTAGSLGLLAMLVGVDPWHDVFLLGSYAAWGAVGRAFDAATSQSTREPYISPSGSAISSRRAPLGSRK